MNQRVRPEVAGPMTSSAKSGIYLARAVPGLAHDLFRKPVSTHRVKPEGMLFGILL
jgi:hypothetical protein